MQTSTATTATVVAGTTASMAAFASLMALSLPIAAVAAPGALTVIESRREVHIADIPTSKDRHFLKVTVEYDRGNDGGYGRPKPRCYELRVNLVREEYSTDREGRPITYQSTIYGLGAKTGGDYMLAPAKAYSAKHLLAHAQAFAETWETDARFTDLLASIAGGQNFHILGPYGEGLHAASEAYLQINIDYWLDIQKKQVEYVVDKWLTGKYDDGIQPFRAAVEGLNATRTIRIAQDIPHGGDIDHLAFTVGMGKTDAEYREWINAVSGS